MENYYIAPAGNGFQIVETVPDGRNRTVDGFSTEADARGWLDSFMVLLGLIECMPVKASRH